MIDFNLKQGSPINKSEIELIYQQMDLLFGTTAREVLGYEDYGTQYDDYLYNLQITEEGLKQVVLADIGSLELFDYKPEVEVYLLQGTEQDIALINITLTKYDEVYKKTYKIS